MFYHYNKESGLIMAGFFNNIRTTLESITSQIYFWDIIDIAIITVLIYLLLRNTKATRAMQVVKGLGALVAVAVITSWLNLSVVSWLLSMLLQSGVIVVIIIFQPEIRRALEKIGRGTFFDANYEKNDINIELLIDELIKAVQNLSKRKVGALMVIEQNSNLNDIIVTGTRLDATLSSMLVENIFEPNTPLHDGAIVIKDNRVIAAGCFLPLSENILLDRKLGTRHRAALGMSERSDAVCIVVSEETGVISYTKAGSLHRYIDSRALRQLLFEIYSAKNRKRMSWFESLLQKLKSDKAGDKND